MTRLRYILFLPNFRDFDFKVKWNRKKVHVILFDVQLMSYSMSVLSRVTHRKTNVKTRKFIVQKNWQKLKMNLILKKLFWGKKIEDDEKRRKCSNPKLKKTKWGTTRRISCVVLFVKFMLNKILLIKIACSYTQVKNCSFSICFQMVSS